MTKEELFDLFKQRERQWLAMREWPCQESSMMLAHRKSLKWNLNSQPQKENLKPSPANINWPKITT